MFLSTLSLLIDKSNASASDTIDRVAGAPFLLSGLTQDENVNLLNFYGRLDAKTR